MQCHQMPTRTINSSRPEHTKRTQGNAEQRKATQSNARRASRTNAAETTPANQKPNTADPEYYSKPPTTENRNLRTNRKPLPSKPPPEAYLNHTVQANQTCQGPPWILPATPVSSGRVQATSKHLTASLRVECVPGTQPHKPVRPTAGRARRNPSTLGSG